MQQEDMWYNFQCVTLFKDRNVLADEHSEFKTNWLTSLFLLYEIVEPKKLLFLFK